MTSRLRIMLVTGLAAVLCPGIAIIPGGCGEDDIVYSDGRYDEVDTVVSFLHDHEYSERRIFDLFRDGETAAGDSVVRLLLYQEIRSDAPDRPVDAVWGILHVNPSHADSFPDERVDLTSVTTGLAPIEQQHYVYYTLPDSNSHRVVLDRYAPDRPIGMYVQIARATGSIDTIGTLSAGTMEDPVELKLLYDSAATPIGQTWGLMWRNCYEITQGDMPAVDIFKGSPDSFSTADAVQCAGDSCLPYLTVLGLDQYSLTDENMPDGRADERVSILRSDWGLLLFPHRRPFASDTTYDFADGSTTSPLQVLCPGIYEGATEADRAAASEYFIRITSYIPVQPTD